MHSSRTPLAFALCLALAAAARAGGPLPDTRQGDFAHVCSGGPNAGQPCTPPTEDADCPNAGCVVEAVSGAIKGTLTLIAHDAVTDWSTGAAGNQALTVLLEVKAPGGGREILTATYQDLVDPASPPRAPGGVVVLPMDELALRDLAAAVGGLLYVQPESALAARLQAVYGSTGAPALVLADRRVQLADHTADALATVLRFKIKLRFLVPA